MNEMYSEDLQFFPGEDFDMSDPIALQVALEATKRDARSKRRAGREWADQF